MELLKSVRFENYRCFEDYRVEGLTRVNLFVGKNNCGKTSVLEGINLLTSKGDPRVIWEILSRRGETQVIGESPQSAADVSHLFYGHMVHHVHQPLGLTGDSPPKYLKMYGGESSFDPEVMKGYDGPLGQSFWIESEHGVLRELTMTWGTIGLVARRHFLGPSPESPFSGFVQINSLPIGSLARQWDRVLIESYDHEVFEVMRILDPRIRDISFTSSQSQSSGALVKLNGPGPRVPLGSFGDGVHRLLALAISLLNAPNGCIFIDEIDTGLHYSVMSDLWRMVTRTAMRHDLQVFATTHSLDAIRGIREAICEEPELESEISVHTLDRRLAHSIPFSGDDLEAAIAGNMEIR